MTHALPISEVLQAQSVDEITGAIHAAREGGTALYPLGGEASLTWGLPPTRDGVGLRVAGLDAVIDYPARDMTITVGAGMTWNTLAGILAAESQRLPIDVPRAEVATVGGLVASGHSGPLRHGLGTLRDYVIGIQAVSGLGRCFSAGGRVVKNVAGYDFCKLLTGSCGTLGVITEVTFKLKPVPPALQLVGCPVRDAAELEALLGGLVTGRVPPVMVECVEQPGWSDFPQFDTHTWLLVGVEGQTVEVEWMLGELRRQWKSLGVEDVVVWDVPQSADLHQLLIDFPCDEGAALIVQLSGVPSATPDLLAACREVSSEVQLQAHAGNGVVVAKFGETPAAGVAAAVNQLRARAAAAQGHAIVLANPSGDEATHQCVWGSAESRYDLMDRVKQAFDPHNLLNPGRFVYAH